MIKKLVDAASKIFSRRVMRSSAAMAYFLTLAVFPFIVLLTAMAGALDIPDTRLLMQWRGLVPEEVLSMAELYLGYVEDSFAPVLITASAVILITSASAAVRTLLTSVGGEGVPERMTGFHGMLLSGALTLLFMLAVAASCVGMILNDRVTELAVRLAGERAERLIPSIRFFPQLILLYTAARCVYGLSVEDAPHRLVRLAALCCAGMLVISGAVFSGFIGVSPRYVLVYGWLASVIVLMLWFRFGSIVMLSWGSVLYEVNGFLKSRKK